MQIVIIEDDLASSQLLRMILRDHDITTYVTWFDDLAVSLDWHAVDVVIADRQLPGADGVDVLKWLEERYPHIRRVMMTVERRITLVESHAHAILRKPALASSVLSAVLGRGVLP